MGMTINLISTTNTYDDATDNYYEVQQGSTFKIIQVFEVLSDDKHVGFFKSEIVLDSYGSPDGDTKISIVKPKTVTTTVWE